jgi:hypothetical protein
MAVIPPLVTATDVCTTSLVKAGIAASGETPDAAMLQDAFEMLNEMVDSWNTERLIVFTTLRALYALVSGKQVYTIGPGGDFNQQRPLWIPYAGLVTQITNPYPLETPLAIWTVQDWAGISTKTNILSPIPQGIYYDFAFSTPAPGGLGNISFWPTFQGGSVTQVALYTPQALAGFADLVTKYGFPPGYVTAIKYNLAVELAIAWGRPLDAALSAKAADKKTRIKVSNYKPDRMTCDDAIVNKGSGTCSSYNIYNDTYGR